MNGNGFLCFLFVLLFASMQLGMQKGHAGLGELNESMALAFEAEKANFLRTVLEENTDFIVASVLEKEALGCRAEPGEIKESVNAALLEFFENAEEVHAGMLEFRAGNGEKLGIGFMQGNSSVVVKRIKGICSISYSFHGGLMRNNRVEAEIGGKMFSQGFAIPAGYSHIVRGVVVG